MRSLLAFVFLFVAVLAVSYASPYNKYGRTCKDILCTIREECVMQKDECTGYTDKCGTYPTCKRKPSAGKTGCAAMKCPTGHFCSIRQENCDKPPCQIKPTCIAFRTPSPNRASNLPDFTKKFTTTTTTTPVTPTTSTTTTPEPSPITTTPAPSSITSNTTTPEPSPTTTTTTFTTEAYHSDPVTTSVPETTDPCIPEPDTDPTTFDIDIGEVSTTDPFEFSTPSEDTTDPFKCSTPFEDILNTTS